MLRVFQNREVQTSDKEPDKTNPKRQGEIIKGTLKTKQWPNTHIWDLKMQIKTTTTTIHFHLPSGKALKQQWILLTLERRMRWWLFYTTFVSINWIYLFTKALSTYTFIVLNRCVIFVPINKFLETYKK